MPAFQLSRVPANDGSSGDHPPDPANRFHVTLNVTLYASPNVAPGGAKSKLPMIAALSALRLDGTRALVVGMPARLATPRKRAIESGESPAAMSPLGSVSRRLRS